jgi:hypothetical protein
MRRRPAVTLIEVLVAIFIMAIGLLALLVLFPLGALSMAEALKKDRNAAACVCARSVSEVQDVRHDLLVSQQFTNPPTLAANQLAGPDAPSHPVFVDPFAVLAGSGPVGALAGVTPGIPRTSVCLSANFPGRTTPLTNLEAAQWFQLPDDMTFNTDATPATSASGFVQRGGRYTWAYLLRRPRAGSDAVVDMSVVVFNGRSSQANAGETTYPATVGAIDTTFVVISYAGLSRPNVRRGSWILDTSLDASYIPPAQPSGTAPPIHGWFYRIAAVLENTGAQTMTLELQSTLKGNATAICAMENVGEVFDKGGGWEP